MMSSIAARGLLVLLFLTAQASAAVTPEMQRAIRAATFEVVMKKPERDPLTYEKPLPLELLPFVERNDAYRSLGTAFALGKNTYVTAAHVLVEGVDTQFGPPALRAADGKVYAIDQILKFSAHEDFAMFSLDKDPAAAGFEANGAPQLDDPVLAVGNALGDGIVIRDGLFTSETAEEQDGRWKWIRFSAAASPGNSGGPLLDAAGRVIGIVIGKSPNENLNYSLPIANVLKAAPNRAEFDQRILVGLTYLQANMTYAFKDGFKLPLPWSEFAKSYQALVERHNREARNQLLRENAAAMFPKGAGSEGILYSVRGSYRPRVISQQSDGAWSSDDMDFNQTDLPGDGFVSVASVPGGTLLRLHRSDKASDDAFYSDSKAFMDLALKALNLRRQVGPDAVRVTSVGPAISEEMYMDRYGRKWQQRVWPVPYMDAYLLGMQLPTPDGYVASLMLASSQMLTEVAERTALLVNQVDVSYWGSLPQWQAFLRRSALLPQSLASVKLQGNTNWKFSSQRFELNAPQAVAMTPSSNLGVTMGFVLEDQKLLWDIVGASMYQDDRQKNYIWMWRQPVPPRSARLELRNRFADMRAERGVYAGLPSKDTSDTFVANAVVEVPGSREGMVSSDLIYGVSMRLEGAAPPLAMYDFKKVARESLKVLEQGMGQDIEPARENDMPIASHLRPASQSSAIVP